MATENLLLAVSIQDDRIRPRLIEDLQSLCKSPNELADWQSAEVVLETFATLESLSEKLSAYFAEPSGRFAVVVSDMLVGQDEIDQRAKQLIDRHFHNPLVTLAVTSDGLRVSDIDRVVKRTADRCELADALRWMTARLRYIAPPAKRDYPNNPFRVRRIDGQTELLRYYKLRYQVYSIMGYISEEKKQSHTKLEIDGCDVNAIHLGAFEQCDGYQRLVGTARILLAEAEETKWNGWTRSLLESDRKLRELVRYEAIPLGLPVFQSQELNDHLQEAFKNNLLCAELSRVIVVYEFRGAGLARRLVEKAIEEAQQAGVARLYLECLPLHEVVYSKFGFRTIPGKSGRVIGVNKSMIAMVLELVAVGAITSDTAVR